MEASQILAFTEDVTATIQDSLDPTKDKVTWPLLRGLKVEINEFMPEGYIAFVTRPKKLGDLPTVQLVKVVS